MKPLLVFDLDGTLIDTVDDLAVSCNVALAHFGYPQYAPEEYKRFIGRGVRKLVWDVIPETERCDENVEKVHEVFSAHYRTHCCDRSRPYPGIPEVLAALSERGSTLCVLSNKPIAFTESIVRALLPPLPFAHIIGQSDRFPQKPDPSSLLFMIDSCGLLPCDCLYVGDSEVDAETAQRGAVPFLGVTWGFRTSEELFEAGAVDVIDRPTELLR